MKPITAKVDLNIDLHMHKIEFVNPFGGTVGTVMHHNLRLYTNLLQLRVLLLPLIKQGAEKTPERKKRQHVCGVAEIE